MAIKQRNVDSLSIRKKFIPTTIMTPAIAIGAFTMYRHHVPVAIWIQNIACLVLMSLISLILFTRKINNLESRHRKFLLPTCLFLLVVTLVSHSFPLKMRKYFQSILAFTLQSLLSQLFLVIFLCHWWDMGYRLSLAILYHSCGI